MAVEICIWFEILGTGKRKEGERQGQQKAVDKEMREGKNSQKKDTNNRPSETRNRRKRRRRKKKRENLKSL